MKHEGRCCDATCSLATTSPRGACACLKEIEFLKRMMMLAQRLLLISQSFPIADGYFWVCVHFLLPMVAPTTPAFKDVGDAILVTISLHGADAATCLVRATADSLDVKAAD